MKAANSVTVTSCYYDMGYLSSCRTVVTHKVVVLEAYCFVYHMLWNEFIGLCLKDVMNLAS